VSLIRGRIIQVTIADPQGRNPKSRPAVVVVPPADASPTAQVRVIGVSTQIGMAPPAVCVELPWQRGGHPRTGLSARCEAVCTWLATITVADVDRELGTVPADRMLRILNILSGLTPPPTPPPAAPPPSQP
jgi:mRNA-degrading endonuclease toxin of MazEF toxin-antitoxin module